MRIVDFGAFVEEKPFRDKQVYMALGVFDGIHQGHQALIRKIDHRGDMEHRFLFTFSRNPKQFLGMPGYDHPISTQRQKVELVTNSKIGNMVLIDFSVEFSKLRGEDFFSMIRESCDLRYIVIGQNFSCGYKALFTAERIEEMFSGSRTVVDVVSSVMIDDERVSSSRIRELIHSGDIKAANRLLGRSFSIDMAVNPHIVDTRTFYIEQRDIVQIQPPPGSYRVVFRTSQGMGHHGRIVVNDSGITCSSDAEMESLPRHIEIVE